MLLIFLLSFNQIQNGFPNDMADNPLNVIKQDPEQTKNVIHEMFILTMMIYYLFSF